MLGGQLSHWLWMPFPRPVATACLVATGTVPVKCYHGALVIQCAPRIRDGPPTVIVKRSLTRLAGRELKMTRRTDGTGVAASAYMSRWHLATTDHHDRGGLHAPQACSPCRAHGLSSTPLPLTVTPLMHPPLHLAVHLLPRLRLLLHQAAEPVRLV